MLFFYKILLSTGILLSLEDRLAMSTIPIKIQNEYTSKLRTQQPRFVIHSALGERLDMPPMTMRIKHSLPVNVLVNVRTRQN